MYHLTAITITLSDGENGRLHIASISQVLAHSKFMNQWSVVSLLHLQ